MSVFTSILVPLDGSRIAARSLGCATWLAARLEARLHILSAASRERPAREALAALRVPEAHWPLVTLHQAPAYPEDAILEAITRHAVDLVVMSACGQTAEAPAAGAPDTSPAVGHVACAVIERSPVPLLLLPPHYREALPWERVLVPVSGETAADEALTLALRLAQAVDLAVHVAHVADSDAGDETFEARARYADALHHEYPHRLEELVSRAVPHGAPEARRRIADVALCRGDVATELLKLIERTPISLLAVGWHGRFMTGHARVLKQLIQETVIPVLMVKAPAPTPFRLKVGEQIE
jgi:nucleotide-binding universal stress UspA family protein